MIRAHKLPSGYAPYKKVNFCTNILLGETLLIALGDVLPVLVGSGTKPQIWIQALQSPQGKKFITLVDASISLHPKVRVEEADGKVRVTVEGKTVLLVEQKSEAELTIHSIDLRPVGFNVYGDSSGLHSGGITFKNSTFDSVGTMMSFSAV
jgi:hypothetical protein